MAEHEEGNFLQQYFVTFLQEATRLTAEDSGLLNVPSAQGVNNEPSQNAITSQSDEPQGQLSNTIFLYNQNIPSITAINRERALGNFARRFTPYPTQSARAYVLSAISGKTWTHNFYCLANHEQCVSPTSDLKAKLEQAGLGEKRICFDRQASAIDVKAKLEEVYPKLQFGGGFDILRRVAQTKDLVFIRPPRSGYSVPFLRDKSILKQAMAFIRPIQSDLDMTPVAVMDSSEVSSH
ncbi:Hypothetical predicted protein [Paramuricea clavata]|uniref:Uncharacterized protein n=1 Tax=Paramuricea clavata TaxID=317549 RepID=A0A6S7HYQ9_PARCT|nr:Hypothetical predicted protein [Paramuricea clavata]